MKLFAVCYIPMNFLILLAAVFGIHILGFSFDHCFSKLSEYLESLLDSGYKCLLTYFLTVLTLSSYVSLPLGNWIHFTHLSGLDHKTSDTFVNFLPHLFTFPVIPHSPDPWVYLHDLFLVFILCFRITLTDVDYIMGWLEKWKPKHYVRWRNNSYWLIIYLSPHFTK